MFLQRVVLQEVKNYGCGNRYGYRVAVAWRDG